MVIEFLPLHDDVIQPAYATVGSAGFDLVAYNFKSYYLSGSGNISSIKDLDIATRISMYPNSRLLVGIGFSVAIPDGYVMLITPRSGNAIKLGLTVLNSPGVIDSDYRGEVGVILHNTSNDVITINKGDKIAQGLITEYIVAVFNTVRELSETVRGVGGFGSTDKKQGDVHLRADG